MQCQVGQFLTGIRIQHSILCFFSQAYPIAEHHSASGSWQGEPGSFLQGGRVEKVRPPIPLLIRGRRGVVPFTEGGGEGVGGLTSPLLRSKDSLPPTHLPTSPPPPLWEDCQRSGSDRSCQLTTLHGGGARKKGTKTSGHRDIAEAVQSHTTFYFVDLGQAFF